MKKSTETPEVGMGITERVGSDCYPYTVVEVCSPTTIIVQADKARRTDKNGQSEMQSYLYEPNPKAARIRLSVRKDGRWRRQGESLKTQGFALGHRQAYNDPSH